MSIASFFNSPKPNYQIYNQGGATAIPINATANSVVTSIVKQIGGTAPLTISVPAGVYDLNMFAQLDMADSGAFEQVNSYSLRLVDLNDPANNTQPNYTLIREAIATTSTYSIGCIPDGGAWLINQSQRIELPQKADGTDYLLSMYILTVWNTMALNITNGPGAQTSMGISALPNFSLRPTY